MTISVLRLQPADADRYTRIRRRMLVDAPWAFAASPEDDRALDPAQLAEVLTSPAHAIFAVEGDTAPDGGARELAAVASIRRETSPKFAHRAGVWGVFADPAYRRRGFGRAVVAAAVAHARTWPGVDWVDLGVSANAPAARALYESLDFVVWGREPDATEIDGVRHDELFLALRL
ncbi:MAG: GNAT family N-acetyltransferase [Gemmatimonadetes bacterium]|nr:GNAT family N-acetyltransferase [Gemmatimonadota bacterium]